MDHSSPSIDTFSTILLIQEYLPTYTRCMDEKCEHADCDFLTFYYVSRVRYKDYFSNDRESNRFSLKLYFLMFYSNLRADKFSLNPPFLIKYHKDELVIIIHFFLVCSIGGGEGQS